MEPIRKAVEILIASGKTLATAESCTGGMVAAAVTDLPGVSACFKGGVVSYSNDVKNAMLGVPQEIMATVGAVSEECAKAMADGVRRRLGADIGISTTGIAGPTGGTPAKPVGLVWFGIATADGVKAAYRVFAGDRDAVRRQAVDFAASLVSEACILPRNG